MEFYIDVLLTHTPVRRGTEIGTEYRGNLLVPVPTTEILVP